MLTALLGFLSILLEYIGLFAVFSLTLYKNNFGVLILRGPGAKPPSFPTPMHIHVCIEKLVHSSLWYLSQLFISYNSMTSDVDAL